MRDYLPAHTEVVSPRKWRTHVAHTYTHAHASRCERLRLHTSLHCVAYVFMQMTKRRRCVVATSTRHLHHLGARISCTRRPMCRCLPPPNHKLQYIIAKCIFLLFVHTFVAHMRSYADSYANNGMWTCSA